MVLEHQFTQDRQDKELLGESESFALLYGRERLSVPVIGIDLLR
nr:hypothetical protein Iba_chr14cCG1790 [Ipomoea batatas]GMD96883.1 hypothetical protein Iba_chr15bCG9080 [Ipomoea batatas]